MFVKIGYQTPEPHSDGREIKKSLWNYICHNNYVAGWWGNNTSFQ